MRVIFDSKLFIGAIIAAVGIAVGYAIFLIGSPMEQRAIQMDERRTSDLSQISSAVQQYWLVKNELPSVFEDLKKEDYFIQSVTDPRTEEQYEYRVLSDTTYELCAVFETNSSQNQISRAPSLFYSSSWEHGVGRTCFEREVYTPDSGMRSPVY